MRQPLTSRLTHTITIKYFDIARSPYPESASSGAAKSLIAPWPDWTEPGPCRYSPRISAASDSSLLTHPDLPSSGRRRRAAGPRTTQPDPFDRETGAAAIRRSQPASSRFESATEGSCQRLR